MGIKTVVITGAESGLGASLARKYSELGYHICLLGRTTSKIEKLTAELKGYKNVYNY